MASCVEPIQEGWKPLTAEDKEASRDHGKERVMSYCSTVGATKGRMKASVSQGGRVKIGQSIWRIT